MRIRYNSPVILTFSIIALSVHMVDTYLYTGFTRSFFSVGNTMNLFNPIDYFRLFSHVLGHGSWGHFLGNITYILLLGPILEEKYGSVIMFEMILFTGVATGVINVLAFPKGLLGASGIVFMLIILASIVDFKQGSIPLTFLLVAGIYIGTEVAHAFRDDSISQAAHIIGGGMGAFFGFLLAKPPENNSETNDR